MDELLTKDQFIKVLPKRSQTVLTDEMIDNINGLITDPKLRENYRDNLLGYTSILTDKRFTLQQYVDAVRYVSFKLMGDTNIGAYVKTFPDRYQRMINEGIPDKDIRSTAGHYNGTMLVNKIFEQTIVPSHVLNADMYQAALNTQAELMVTARSEKVRSDAANSLLTHLKMPETKKIELDIGIKEDKSINDLRNSTMELVAMQKKMIESNVMNAQQIAHSKLLIEDGELVE